jgi:NAD(P)H-nitrite reductase large subunit
VEDDLLCECFLIGYKELEGLTEEEILLETYLGKGCGKCLPLLNSFLEKRRLYA